MRSNITASRRLSESPIWPGLLAGIMATLVGIGLARFAYTPLIPVLIDAGWFSASDAAYLGAANLLGYFIGALSAHRLTERFAPRLAVKISLAVIVLSFVFCAWPASFNWFFVWRLLSGLAGAILMVTVPSVVLSSASVAQRAVVGTLTFTGIGIGAVLAAVVIPALLSFGLALTWFALAAVSLVFALLCDLGMRRLAQASQASQAFQLPAATAVSGSLSAGISPARLVVWLVLLAYALDAAGFVPHTVFWVDYLAREKGFGQAQASLQWAVFGVGALCGPFLARRLVAKWGWGTTLMLALGLKAMAIAMPAVSLAFISQTLSSFLVGALVPGVTALTSGRLSEIVGPARHKQVWGQATAAFAAAQAISGYGMSVAYDHIGTYTPLYVVASAMLAVGAVLVASGARRPNR